MAVAYSEVDRVFVDGDPDALSAAYNMWGALVYTIALRGTGDSEAAGDITRRTFFSVWHSAQVPCRWTLKTRLVLTARTLVHARLGDGGATKAQISAADQIIDRVVVRDELTAMPQPQRAVLLVALSERSDLADVAARTGMPAEQAEPLLRDGVQTLAVALASSRPGEASLSEAVEVGSESLAERAYSQPPAAVWRSIRAEAGPCGTRPDLVIALPDPPTEVAAADDSTKSAGRWPLVALLVAMLFALGLLLGALLR